MSSEKRFAVATAKASSIAKNNISFETSFSLATNETWLNADDEKIDNTEWHNIIVWNKLAEFANDYLFKGQSIYLEGKIRTSHWEDEKTGYKRSKVEIVCSNIIPLEWRDKSAKTKSDENHK